MKHIHHIIPKHMGGTDDLENLIELTVEEHALAHLRLYEQYGNWQDKIAYEALSGRIGQEEALRLKQGLANKGRKRSPETIAKLKESCRLRTERWKQDGTWEKANLKRSESHKGKKKSKEHLEKWSAARKGHTVSEETKEKIRKTLAETRAKKKAP